MERWKRPRRRWVALVGLAAALTMTTLLSASAPLRLQNLADATATGCPHSVSTPSAVVPPPTDTSPQAIAAYNAVRVLETPRPVYDFYSQGGVRPEVPCRVRTKARDEKVGHVQTFWLLDENAGRYRQVQANLVLVTPHLYMYVAQDASSRVDTNALRAAADRFETHTYANDRLNFGPQWALGPDDDPHITVLHETSLCQCGAYFSLADEYPKSVMPYSNERQMIYVNLDGGSVPGSDFYDASLAHEFQHTIHWYWRPADSAWLNEGMSMVAMHLNGFTTGGVENAFLAEPDTMVGGWTDDPNLNVAHYGAAFLFLDYFAEHYGGYGVFKELMADPAQAPLNFDHVLAAHGYSDRFDDVFANFAVANIINAPVGGSGANATRYLYPTIPWRHATPQHPVSAYPASDAGAVHQYATEYYDLQPSSAGTLALSFAGNPTVGIVDNTPYKGGSAEWWSNSADGSQTTLTHAFDLRPLAGQSATLQFEAWYSLEAGPDSTYVEVSTDKGATWITVPASVAVASAAGRGDGGLTGISGSKQSDASCGPQSRWVPVTADLSQYAGQQILLRFATETNNAVHCPGTMLDDIRIPEIGFADDVSTDNGWQAAGYIRSNNVLPERYFVQAIVYSSSGAVSVQRVSVQRVSVDAASGAGQVTIPGFGSSVSRVVLAVSAVAPTTITPAHYTLSARMLPG